MRSKTPSSIKYLLQLNLASLLISTSGPLARYVDLPSPVVIGCRSILAALLLLGFCRWKKISLVIAKKDRLAVLLGGILMAAHWITYFYALQWSSVAIGMLSLYSYPVLTALLEPLLFKTKIQGVHILLGILVLFGLYLLIPDFSLENTYTKAIAIGVLSALCYAFRNMIMKTQVTRYHGSTLMSYQLMIIAVICTPFVVQSTGEAILNDILPITALALGTTAIGHTLMLYSFKHFSITTASIISSMQPIFGIILGAVFLKEIPEMSTLIGGAIILTTVGIESIRSYKK